MITTVCARISKQEKRKLKKYGKLSTALREGVKLCLSKKQPEELFSKLAELQASSLVKTLAEDEAKLIRKDRKN